MASRTGKSTSHIQQAEQAGYNDEMDNRLEQTIALWPIPKIGDYWNWYWTTTTRGEWMELGMTVTWISRHLYSLRNGCPFGSTRMTRRRKFVKIPSLVNKFQRPASTRLLCSDHLYDGKYLTV